MQLARSGTGSGWSIGFNLSRRSRDPQAVKRSLALQLSSEFAKADIA